MSENGGSAKGGKKGIKLNFVESFVLSGAAAIISKTAAAPIERVKLLIQNQDEMIKDQVKSMFKANPNESYPSKFAKNIMSGGVAGSLSLLFVYSLDYCRTRLANDAKVAGKGGGERQFNGIVDVYSKTIKSDGIAGLYRGFVISCIGIFVYRGFYFGLYDSLKPILLGHNANLMSSFLLGYGVTVTSGLISYPIDTIRRRMMMTSGQAVKYKGSIDATRQIIAKEGAMSLMKGAGANILRGIAGAGVLAGFDKFKEFYIDMRYPSDPKVIVVSKSA